MGQFSDERFWDKPVIRHGTFDGSAFCVLFQKKGVVGEGLGFGFRANKHPL